MSTTTHQQTSAYTSPWTKKQRVKMLLWEHCWLLFCAWTPKPANAWRVWWLKVFGATIYGKPFVHSARAFKFPGTLPCTTGPPSVTEPMRIPWVKSRCTSTLRWPRKPTFARARTPSTSPPKTWLRHLLSLALTPLWGRGLLCCLVLPSASTPLWGRVAWSRRMCPPTLR